MQYLVVSVTKCLIFIFLYIYYSAFIVVLTCCNCCYALFHCQCQYLSVCGYQWRNRHDWVTKDLKADMKKREELFKISKKNPTEHNIQAHKKFRNIVLSRQRQAERKHFKEQYDQSLNEQNYKKSLGYYKIFNRWQK